MHLLIDHMNEFAGKRDVERIVVYEVKPEKKSRFARSWLGAFHLGIKIAKVGDKE